MEAPSSMPFGGRGVERLPPEICQMILRKITDLQSLLSAVLSGAVLHSAFLTDKTNIIHGVRLNHLVLLDRGVYQAALMAMHATKVDINSERQVTTYLKDWLDEDPSARSFPNPMSLARDEVRDMSNLLQQVDDLSVAFVDYAQSKVPLVISDETRALSDREWNRVRRAFCHTQVLNALVSPGTQAIRNAHFLGFYKLSISAWEYAQAIAVSDFIDCKVGECASPIHIFSPQVTSTNWGP
jgi:hypothetical protein